MKSKLAGVGASKAVMGGSLALLLCAAGARPDAIPYPTPGVVNPRMYTFTAHATGDVVAYFAGSSADITTELGLQVNGVSTGVFGLNNHSSAVGASLNLGHANAGDVLTFVLRPVCPCYSWLATDAFSNPALNATYDGGVGIQHVYATPYTATSPIIDAIPVGTFVAWEDLPGMAHPDFDYNDLTFVITNVSVSAEIAQFEQPVLRYESPASSEMIIDRTAKGDQPGRSSAGRMISRSPPTRATARTSGCFRSSFRPGAVLL